MASIYDVVIVGAGPAGMTAGIYLGRARLNTAVFEKAMAGGQMVVSDWIENFPGFSEGITGMELSAKMREHALKCGAKIIEEEVIGIEKIVKIGTDTIYLSAEATGINGVCPYFLLKTGENKEYKALSVVIATGAVPKKMGIPGEEKFTGKGVSYCATCDAPLFKDKAVVVIGGGDTAVQEALFLAKYCKKIYLVHRRDRLRAAKILAERFKSCEKIEPVWNSVVAEIKGDKKVTGVVINDVGARRAVPLHLPCDGVFIFAGITPASEVAKGLVDMDENGRIITDDDMKTSCAGVFACGDVREKMLWQIVTACGEAATASVSAQHYVEKLKGEGYN